MSQAPLLQGRTIIPSLSSSRSRPWQLLGIGNGCSNPKHHQGFGEQVKWILMGQLWVWVLYFKALVSEKTGR